MRGSLRLRLRGELRRLSTARRPTGRIRRPINLLIQIRGSRRRPRATRRTGSADSLMRHPWRTRQRPLAFPYPTLKTAMIVAWPPGAQGTGQGPPSSSGAMRASTPSFCAERRIIPPIPIWPERPRRTPPPPRAGGLRRVAVNKVEVRLHEAILHHFHDFLCRQLPIHEGANRRKIIVVKDHRTPRLHQPFHIRIVV